MLIVALLLGGGTPALARPRAAPEIGESGRYLCADGRRIEILYGGDAVVLTIGDVATQMTRTPPAEKYAGGGWQWAATGQRSGTLAAASGSAGTVCRIA